MVLTATLTLSACSGDRTGQPVTNTPKSPAEASASPAPAMRLLVLGDSTASETTCPGCTIYPDQLASAMAKEFGADVLLDNLAWVLWNPKAAEVADVLEFVRTDPTARDSVADADAVLITVGHNDLAYNRLDDPCGVAPRYPRVDWKSLTHACINRVNDEYRRDLDALLGEIEQIREGTPTMLRVTNVYNSVIGDLVDPTWNSPAAIEPSMYAVEQMVRAQCEVAERHDGSCADTYHALNGEDGSESAQDFLNPVDATHLAQAGEDAFAAAIISLGLSPLG